MSEVTGNTFDFPIPVADGVGTAAAVKLLGLLRHLAIDFGTTGFRFGERPLGGRGPRPNRRWGDRWGHRRRIGFGVRAA